MATQHHQASLYIQAYAPVVAWAGLIFWFSAQQTLPSPNDAVFNFLLKKTAHLVVYAVFYLLTFRALYLTKATTSPLKQALIPLLITLLYAGSDELHQSFVAGRTASLRDIGFDFLGASMALLWTYRLI